MPPIEALAGATPAVPRQFRPAIPPRAESGGPGYDGTSWYGLMVPGGTSGEVIARLNGAVMTALATPEVKRRFSPTGLDPVASTPEQFGAHVRAEVVKWAKVIKASGMKAD